MRSRSSIHKLVKDRDDLIKVLQGSDSESERVKLQTRIDHMTLQLGERLNAKRP